MERSYLRADRDAIAELITRRGVAAIVRLIAQVLDARNKHARISDWPKGPETLVQAVMYKAAEEVERALRGVE